MFNMNVAQFKVQKAAMRACIFTVCGIECELIFYILNNIYQEGLFLTHSYARMRNE